MCKSEIFFNLLGLTERETEVPKERILGDFRDMESTDARYCNLQIFLCLFLEKLNMPQNTPVTKAS